MRGDIKRNANLFMNELMLIADKAEKSASDVIVKTCFDLFASIVKRTPVDTGRARANWNIDTQYDESNIDNAFDESEVEQAQRGVSEAMKSAESLLAKAKTEFVEQIFIYNNLEYIEALEDGHSRQRPAGMVSVSLANFARQLDKNARKAGFKT